MCFEISSDGHTPVLSQLVIATWFLATSWMDLVLSRKHLLSAQPWGGRKYKKILGEVPPGSFPGPCCAFLTSSPVSWPGVPPCSPEGSVPGCSSPCFPARPWTSMSLCSLTCLTFAHAVPSACNAFSQVKASLLPSKSLIKPHQSPPP